MGTKIAYLWGLAFIPVLFFKEGDRSSDLVLFSATIVCSFSYLICGQIECNWLNGDWYCAVSVS